MWGEEEEEDEEEEDEEEAVRPGTAAGCIYKVPKVDTRPNLPPTYLLHKVYMQAGTYMTSCISIQFVGCP